MIPVIQKTIQNENFETPDSFIILIDKDENWTSFDAVKKIRGLLKIKKAGHAGTLDPFATGLLILGVGKATKMLSEFAGMSKVYEATVRFGEETDSYDKTGNLIETFSTESLDYEKIQRVVNEMKGELEQLPPMYSAKKINGKRLYTLARQNKEVERKPIKVNIISSEILEWQNPFLKMRLHVSKGTYIRSFAHDLGRNLDNRAHLSELRRVEIGSFSVENAFRIPEFIEYWNRN